jgi:hypothetical protein
MLEAFTQRFLGKSSHPLGDSARVAQVLEDLPRDNAPQLLGEASALLDSIEDARFDAAHRLNVVSMIDEAAHAAVDELTLLYIGAIPRGAAGRLQDWRALSDYVEKLSNAYTAAIDAGVAQAKGDVDTRLALYLARAMRVITGKMRTGWVRYLPPDRASWESMAKYYRIAVARKLTTTLVKAYESDSGNTCPAYELAAAAMLTAAVPQSLTPREIETVCRIAVRFGSGFARTNTQDADSVLYVDLDNPSAPVLVRAQPPQGRSLLFFGPGTIPPKLSAILDRTSSQASTLIEQLGTELGPHEKLSAVEHALKFWSPNPPSRREARTRINTSIQAVIGVAAIQRMLGHLSAVPEQSVSTASGKQQGTVHTWTLTDFSTHGIGARLSRRPDGWLTVGSVVGFRLERSPQWAVGIVRRLRCDMQNQTDIGIEILAKATELVSLEAWAPGTSNSTIVNVRSGALLLPGTAHLHETETLLLEPGTYNPADTFIIHRGSGARKARLASTAESLDGWNRVDLEWIEAEHIEVNPAPMLIPV